MSNYNLCSPEFFNALTPYRKSILLEESKYDADFMTASLEADYLIESYALDMKRAELTVLKESGDYDMLDRLYTESSDKKGAGIMESLKKLCDTIINFIVGIGKKIKGAIEKVFGKFAANKLTADDFSASDTYNMSVNMHYEQELNKLDSKMSDAERLMRKGASMAGIDDAEVDKLKAQATGLIESLPDVAIKAATGAVVAGGTIILSKNYKKIASGIITRIDSLGKRVQNIKNSITGKNPKAEKKVIEVVSEISKEETSIMNKLALGMVSMVRTIKRVGVHPDTISAAMNPSLGKEIQDATAKKSLWSKIRGK